MRGSDVEWIGGLESLWIFVGHRYWIRRDYADCSGRWSLVILMAPDEVPSGRDNNKSDEDYAGVVHCGQSDRDE